MTIRPIHLMQRHWMHPYSIALYNEIYIISDPINAHGIYISIKVFDFYPSKIRAFSSLDLREGGYHCVTKNSIWSSNAQRTSSEVLRFEV